MKNTVLLTMLCLATPAFGYDAVEDIQLEKCNLQSVVWVRYSMNVNAQGNLAKTNIELLDQLQKIAAKATKAGVSVGDQLSKEDNIKFDQVRQRLITTGMRGLIESKWERDAKVVNELVQVADKNYRYQQEIQKGHSDYVYQEILLFLRSLEELKHRDPFITVFHAKQCSIDLALYLVEIEGIEKINKTDMSPLNLMLKDFQERYKMKTINREKLSATDKTAYDNINHNLLEPYRRELQFVTDLENIRSLAKASEIIYESDKHDLEFSGGDGAKVGLGLDERVKKDEFDFLTLASINLLRTKINEEIPSDAFKEAQRRAKKADEINKKYPVKPKQ